MRALGFLSMKGIFVLLTRLGQLSSLSSSETPTLQALLLLLVCTRAHNIHEFCIAEQAHYMPCHIRSNSRPPLGTKPTGCNIK